MSDVIDLSILSAEILETLRGGPPPLDFYADTGIKEPILNSSAPSIAPTLKGWTL